MSDFGWLVILFLGLFAIYSFICLAILFIAALCVENKEEKKEDD